MIGNLPFEAIHVLNCNDDNEFFRYRNGESQDNPGVFEHCIDFGEIDGKYDEPKEFLVAYLKNLAFRLYDELRRYSYLFSLYLNSIKPGEIHKERYKKFEKVSAVIAYNYTNFVENVLDCNNESVLFINGENKDLSKKLDSIVFGIDSDINLHIQDFRIFTKSIQRSLKNTGVMCLDKFRSSAHYDAIYIFGHSLTLADKESLKFIFEIFSYDKIVVFCYNDDSRIQATLNFHSIVGEEKFLELQRKNSLVFCDSVMASQESEYHYDMFPELE